MCFEGCVRAMAVLLPDLPCLRWLTSFCTYFWMRKLSTSAIKGYYCLLSRVLFLSPWDCSLLCSEGSCLVLSGEPSCQGLCLSSCVLDKVIQSLCEPPYEPLVGVNLLSFYQEVPVSALPCYGLESLGASGFFLSGLVPW